MQGKKNLMLGSSCDEYELAKTLRWKRAEWVSEAELGHCGHSEVIEE